jgi:CheY-like chemotaxis protein
MMFIPKRSQELLIVQGERRMHFLVADPNVAFAALLTEELERLGYDVTACGSGAEAITSAKARMPDLALLDMALSRPGALAVAKQLRTLDPSVRLMLIPLMGEEPQLDASAPTIQGVLPKPFFLPELPERIEFALNAPLNGASGDVEVAPASESPEAVEIEPEAVPAPGAQPVVEPTDGVSLEAFRRHVDRIERLMQELCDEVNADATLITSSTQGVLAAVGRLDDDEVASISRMVVNGWQASAEMARILGNEQLRFEQSIAGGSYILYALSVHDLIMAVTIRGTAPLGLLRHRARATAERIAELCAA